MARFVVATAAVVAAFEDSNFDDSLSLLQLSAKRSNATQESPELGHDHQYAFDNCATFGNAGDILGTSGNWKTTADIGYCKCWGDTHCSHVPFDEGPARNAGIGGGWALHYQYNGLGASRFAKADDGSWEIQVWQCGGRNANRRGLGLQRGVAVKVGSYLAESVLAANGQWKCFVNGEDKTEPVGQEFHLPNGFHFRCPGNPDNPRVAHPPAFCATLDGQFVTSVNMWEWKSQLNHLLAVPWSVEVQKRNTMCYDASSKDNPMIKHGKEMSQTAVVPSDEVIFSPAAFEIVGGPASQCLLNEPRQEPQPVNPDGPVDAKAVCDAKHPELWEHAQDNCAPLREHESFYEDCLVDECLRAEDSEEEVIEEMVEAEEAADGGDDRCAIEPLVLKTPLYSNLGESGPDAGNPEGILYPEAGVINGQVVNVRLTAVGDYTPFKAAMNTVDNGLAQLNMRCGTSADLQIQIESTAGDPIEVDALALTVYDLDEGKKAKGRTTVTACGSTVHPGSELAQAVVDGCPSVTSTKHGGAQNNPIEASGVTADQESRSASFAFGKGSSFPLNLSMAKAPKGRNVLFSLQPVVGC